MPRGADRVPLSIVAGMTGLSRMTLYNARGAGQVSEETTAMLTPLIRQFEAVKLRFRRTSRLRRDNK
jgi:hypothetical protein